MGRKCLHFHYQVSGTRIKGRGEDKKASGLRRSILFLTTHHRSKVGAAQQVRAVDVTSICIKTNLGRNKTDIGPRKDELHRCTCSGVWRTATSPMSTVLTRHRASPFPGPTPRRRFVVVASGDGAMQAVAPGRQACTTPRRTVSSH